MELIYILVYNEVMKVKTNFHTHNYRCGHAVGNTEDYVKEAVRHGYTELGISDHAPLPDYYFDRMKMGELDDYLKEIEAAAEKYKDRIKVYKSLEIEYFPEFQNYYDELKKKLDYIILGLHAFRYEGEKEIFSAWKIKDEKAVAAYGRYMIEAIESGNFDYVAHPDLYMIAYRKWTEAAEKTAHGICRAAEKMKIPLEINANGIRKTYERHPDWDRYMYPYREFWEVAGQYNVKCIIGSDAHDYKILEDKAMEDSRRFAEELGLSIIETIF